MRSLLFLSLFGFFAAPAAALAQASVEVAAIDGAPALQAALAETLPTLDGDVLNDPAWQAAPVATGFRQTTPREGAPASERTEVRVLYGATTLYVGVVLYDRQPARILASDSRRDAALSDTDSFSFLLDTYHDGQNGFVFGTNPAGIEYDAQVTNEGQGGGGFSGPRQTGGAIAGFNLNWDGSWSVQTETGPYGWSAEFAIPFRTLRFPRSTIQTWGVNFKRTIHRASEEAFWAPLPRQYDLTRVSLAGTLDGLHVPRSRTLLLMPYALTQTSRDYLAATPADAAVDAGFDAKLGVTPSLTLDVTINTDFAQVEVDEQQVNLDRFNLFFPEKRPFFLENAGLFSAGEPGDVELFFSRRIGIGPGGIAVPIRAGARLSGDAGFAKVGLMNMQTGSVDGIVPGNNFTVARVKRELPNRSALGLMLTNRESTGDAVLGADYNRLVAVDGQLGVGLNGVVSGFASRTFTPGIEGAQHAYNVAARLNSEAWMLSSSWTDVAAGFNPEVGFLRRYDYRKYSGLIFHRYRPADFLGFLEIRPHTSFNSYWGRDGFHESMFWHIDTHWEWRSGYEIHTGYNRTREGVREPFEIAEDVVVPAGTFDHGEAMLVLYTDERRPLSLRVRSIIGGFFGGDRISTTSTLAARRGERLTAELQWNRNDVHLPAGDFVINLVGTRLSYSFTPRLYLQGLVQYNDGADLWSANVRFGWVRSAGTGLFLVYNQTNDLFEPGVQARRFSGGPQQRAFIIKYTHLFDVLR